MGVISVPLDSITKLRIPCETTEGAMTDHQLKSSPRWSFRIARSAVDVPRRILPIDPRTILTDSKRRLCCKVFSPPTQVRNIQRIHSTRSSSSVPVTKWLVYDVVCEVGWDSGTASRRAYLIGQALTVPSTNPVARNEAKIWWSSSSKEQDIQQNQTMQLLRGRTAYRWRIEWFQHPHGPTFPLKERSRSMNPGHRLVIDPWHF